MELAEACKLIKQVERNAPPTVRVQSREHSGSVYFKVIGPADTETTVAVDEPNHETRIRFEGTSGRVRVVRTSEPDELANIILQMVYGHVLASDNFDVGTAIRTGKMARRRANEVAEDVTVTGFSLPDGRVRGDAETRLRSNRFQTRDRDFHRHLHQHYSPREFEFLVGDIWDNLGYSTEVTQQSNDKGVDVHIDSMSAYAVGQAKHQKTVVSIDRVQRLAGVIEYFDADLGVLITSSKFTADAVEAAIRMGRIELVSSKELATLYEEVYGGWDSHHGKPAGIPSDLDGE